MNEFKYCQPDSDCASCGACCGMYNWKGSSRALVEEVLEFQTGQFLKSDRGEKDLLRLKQEISKSRPAVLYPVIYNCEFLGFTGNGRKRVGCLLHPDLNGGKNLRRLSDHGRETCDQSRCTAYFYLREAEAELVAKAVDDWYLYGLALTDLDLVKEFFRLSSEMVCDAVSAEKVLNRPELKDIFRHYLWLKEKWPYAKDGNRFGKYFFQAGEYLIYRIDYPALSAPKSRYDRILNSLGSEFQSRSELWEAEELLGQIFQNFRGNWH